MKSLTLVYEDGYAPSALKYHDMHSCRKKTADKSGSKWLSTCKEVHPDQHKHLESPLSLTQISRLQWCHILTSNTSGPTRHY